MALVALSILASTIAASTAYAKTDVECIAQSFEITGAMKYNDWSGLLDLLRNHIAECRSFMTNEEWVESVQYTSLALQRLGRFAEGLAVADRCMTAFPESMRCMFMRGDALVGLEKFRDARAAYAQVIKYGALTDYEVRLQQIARKQIARIDSIHLHQDDTTMAIE